MSTPEQEPHGRPPPAPDEAAPDEAVPSEAVHEPAKLLRIAAMVRALVDEVRDLDLNEAGRERLAEIHNRTLAMLRDVVSDELEEELSQVALSQLTEDAPSSSELRVAQAQLAGWLDGLFRGIQASIASQQMSAQQQLAQMRQQQQLPPGADPRGGERQPGQYL